MGRAWSAIREDEDAAEAMGVPTFTMKLWAFAIGASTGGLGGWIYASKVSFINPDNFPFFLSITILAGGRARWHGVDPGRDRRRLRHRFPSRVPPRRGRWRGDHRLAQLRSPAATSTTITEYRVLLFGAALVRDDDLPAAGADPEPAAGRGADGRAYRHADAGAERVRSATTIAESSTRALGGCAMDGRDGTCSSSSGSHDGVRRRASRSTDVSLDGPGGRDPRHHRAQRRRQDHAVQLRHRRSSSPPRATSAERADRSSASDRTASPRPAWPARSRTSACSRT